VQTEETERCKQIHIILCLKHNVSQHTPSMFVQMEAPMKLVRLTVALSYSQTTHAVVRLNPNTHLISATVSCSSLV
jgi:hypothetical protein